MRGWLSGWMLVAGCGRIGFDTVTDVGDGSIGEAGPLATSCANIAPICGPSGTSSCCDSPLVPGGTFYRSYDGVGFDDNGYPATVSAFRLDKYEITVSRFRQFVSAGYGTQQNPPQANAGGRTLNGVANQGGWDPIWNDMLATDGSALAAALECNAMYETWSDMPGATEPLPINCVTWYEAMAFCIWDGGFLPTDAEWNYAAQGGGEQRAYAWSNPATSTAIDCMYANYYDGTMYCVNDPNGGTNRVGSESPQGDGRWTQAGLTGNVWEWTLDFYASPYPTTTCDDCANLTAASRRVSRGGSFTGVASSLRAAYRFDDLPDSRMFFMGFRCARAP